MHRVRLQSVGGRPTEITVERIDRHAREVYSYRHGEHHGEVEVETLAPWSGWLHLHGRIVPYHAARTGDTIEVWIGGRRHRLELVPLTARRANAAAEVAASDTLLAPMPGTIRKIEVRAGDSFEAHQAIVVMESMKMEMTLSSPRAGRVKDILCKVGDLVAMGELLVRLDPIETA